MSRVYTFLTYQLAEMFTSNGYVSYKRCVGCDSYRGALHRTTESWEFYGESINHTYLVNYTSKNSSSAEVMGYVVDNISFTILMITVLMANKSVNLATLVDNIPYEIGVLNDLLDVLSVIKESMGFRNYNNSQMLYFNSFVHDLLVKVDLVNRNYKNLNLNQFSGLA